MTVKVAINPSRTDILSTMYRTLTAEIGSMEVMLIVISPVTRCRRVLNGIAQVVGIIWFYPCQ